MNRHSIFGLAAPATTDCVCPPGMVPWPTMQGNTVCKDPRTRGAQGHIPCGIGSGGMGMGMGPAATNYGRCTMCNQVLRLPATTPLKGNPTAEMCMGCLDATQQTDIPLYMKLMSAGVG